MNRKNPLPFSLLAAVLALGLLFGCQMASPENAPAPSRSLEDETSSPLLVSNLASESVRQEVKAVLSEHDLCNVDAFIDLARDFADLSGPKANLAGDWTPPDRCNPDIFACQDAWEASHDESDMNCRMTAFLLLRDAISMDRLNPDYDGTYLMFDLDAIETVEAYRVLRDKELLFQSLFGEIDVAGIPQTELPQVFADTWKEKGCRIDREKASLLSLVLHVPDENVLFVGHTGVLIDCGDHCLFVEKIAFQQPYQVTKFDDMDALIHLLSQRGEYFGTGDEAGPFLYQNGTLLRDLSGSRPQAEDAGPGE